MITRLPHDWATCTMDTPLGELRLAASPRGLAGAWFTTAQVDAPPDDGRPPSPEHPTLTQARAALTAYFAGQAEPFDLALDLSCGTPFQQAVWEVLRRIPYGATRTYREIATAIGRAQAVRAVGRAIGQNPLSIVIPCHRVLGSDGSLTGYAGGLDRKRALLALEGIR